MEKITLRKNWQSQIKAIADKVSKNIDRDYCIDVEISNPLYKELEKTTFLKSLEDEYGVHTSFSICSDDKHKEYTLWVSGDGIVY